MRDIRISINKDEVYEEVAKTTAYIGGKTLDVNGKSLYDQVFVTDSDREMLEMYWNAAIDDVSVALDSVLAWQTSYSGEEEAFGLRVSNLFNESLTKTLQSSIFSYVVNKIVAGWCSVVAADKVENYEAVSKTYLAKITEIIYARKRPTR